MTKELLFSLRKKDFVITYYSGSGSGGQHRNKHQNCVRILHSDSGATGTGTEQRSRLQNLKKAFIRLCKSKKFNDWIKLRASRESLNVDEINKKIEEMMKPENIKIEYL
ncbi:MAG: peptide chain release factor-like protein [archaeon]|uniref:Putative RF-1 domain containing protein n=1 Tax=viral metagenome TaxID=1070528 RepID=A0A6M3IDG3_9ZZZZ